MKALLKQEFRSNWRSFRYPAFLLILLFFALLNPLMLKYMNELLVYFATGIEITMPAPTPQEAFFSFLSDASQIGVLVLIFIVMGSVAREKETSVTGWLLSKPIGRWQYLFTKLLTTCGLVITGLLASSAVAFAYTTTLIGQPPIEGAVLATLNLTLFTLLIATITFTLSTLFKSSLQAGGLSLLFFFMSGILNLVLAKSAAADYYPNTLLALMKPLLEGTATAEAVSSPMAVTLLLILLLILLAGSRFARLEL